MKNIFNKKREITYAQQGKAFSQMLKWNCYTKIKKIL